MAGALSIASIGIATVAEAAPLPVAKATAVAGPSYEQWHVASGYADKATCEEFKSFTASFEPVMGCFYGGYAGWEFEYWN